MDRDAERALARLSRRQLGVFARRQAIMLGIGGDTVDGRVRSGRYERLLRGVLGDPMAPDSWERRAMAAVLWAGPGATLARSTAARAHLLLQRSGHLQVVVQDRRLRPPAGITVHRTRALPEVDRATVGPLPVTSLARTVCDVGADVDEVRLRDVLAAALRTGSVTAADLFATLDRLGTVRGAATVRRLLGEVSPLDAQCATPLETAYLRLARRFDIVPTAMNLAIRDRDGRRRYLDAAHVPERLPIELDGEATHTTSLDALDDLVRESVIVGHDGWRTPLRFTWGDVHDRPEAVARIVRRALATTP